MSIGGRGRSIGGWRRIKEQELDDREVKREEEKRKKYEDQKKVGEKR